MTTQNNNFIPATKLTAFRWGDIVLIIGLVVVTALSFKLFEGTGTPTVLIYRDNTVIAQYPLSDEKTVSVRGDIGDVGICIKNGAVKIDKSSCQHQICVRAGTITNSYGQLICAPNHILVCIRSRENKRLQLDAISQ